MSMTVCMNIFDDNEARRIAEDMAAKYGGDALAHVPQAGSAVVRDAGETRTVEPDHACARSVMLRTSVGSEVAVRAVLIETAVAHGGRQQFRHDRAFGGETLSNF